MKQRADAIAAGVDASSASGSPRYRLRLYISGAGPLSSRAIANIKAIADRHLHGRYDLEVIDAYQQPGLIRNAQIVVLPTLIKRLPLPTRRIVGDLSNEARVVRGLGLDLVSGGPGDTEADDRKSNA